MKFITEEDLRDIYKEEPFTNYEVEPGARLTPGARQFLADRGINMFDDDMYNKKKTVTNRQPEETSKCKNNWKEKKLYSKVKSIESSFFLVEEDLLHRDVDLAQSVIVLRKQLTCVKNAMETRSSMENLCCRACTGINEENFSACLEDCFEITEFHVQLEKGKEIISLHMLRTALQEIEPIVLEFYEDIVEEKEQVEFIISNVNQIINSLSQLICLIFGGKKCQKQN